MNKVNRHSAEVDRIRTLVEKLLAVLELDVTLKCELEGDLVYFNVEGSELSHLLGHRNETPRALTSLLQHVLDRHQPPTELRVKFDVNRVLRDQEERLVSMAEEGCVQLAEAGKDVTLGPFNPYERRIIHMALQEKEGVETHSLGEGHLKRIVIRLSKPVLENG